MPSRVAYAEVLGDERGVTVAAIIEAAGYDTVLGELVRFGFVHGVTPPQGAADMATRFIAERYGSRITVADVAHAVSLSEHRLARLPGRDRSVRQGLHHPLPRRRWPAAPG